MSVLRPVTSLLMLGVALALTAPATGAAVAAPSPTARPGASSPVTWNGWRGVGFDTPLARARQELGGQLYRGATDGGCGWLLTTRTGTLDGNAYRHPRHVGDIRVAKTIAYPLGIRGTMSADAAVKRAEASGYTFTTHRYDPYGTGVYTHDNLLVGPHGHTLYFDYTDDSQQIDRLGLAATKHVAHELLDINGC